MSEMSPTTMLRPFRRKAGLGLRELARAAGISPGYLADLEAGRRVPSSAVAADLNRILDAPAVVLPPTAEERIAASREAAFREGAEAMREAAAAELTEMARDAYGADNGPHYAEGRSYEFGAARIRALPLPEVK